MYNKKVLINLNFYYSWKLYTQMLGTVIITPTGYYKWVKHILKLTHTHTHTL